MHEGGVKGFYFLPTSKYYVKKNFSMGEENNEDQTSDQCSRSHEPFAVVILDLCAARDWFELQQIVSGLYRFLEAVTSEKTIRVTVNAIAI